MRFTLNITLAALCIIVGYYIWPLIIGYAIYRIVRPYVMRYLYARSAKRTPKWVTRVHARRARLTYVR